MQNSDIQIYCQMFLFFIIIIQKTSWELLLLNPFFFLQHDLNTVCFTQYSLAKEEQPDGFLSGAQSFKEGIYPFHDVILK